MIKLMDNYWDTVRLTKFKDSWLLHKRDIKTTDNINDLIDVKDDIRAVFKTYKQIKLSEFVDAFYQIFNRYPPLNISLLKLLKKCGIGCEIETDGDIMLTYKMNETKNMEEEKQPIQTPNLKTVQTPNVQSSNELSRGELQELNTKLIQLFKDYPRGMRSSKFDKIYHKKFGTSFGIPPERRVLMFLNFFIM
eukprot:UN33713